MGGSIFMSLFYIFGKLGHNRIARKEENVEGLRLLCEPILILSLVVLFFGCVINTVGLGYGNQMLFATTSSFTIIVNSFMGTCILKEKLSKMDLAGIVIACVGSYFYL